MSRRAIAKPGQKYQDANKGRVISVSADVLDIKTRIESQWPQLTVAYDQIDGQWLIIQKWHDEQGELHESLFQAFDELSEDTIRICAEADPDSRHYVPVEERVDKHNDQRKKDQEFEFADKIGDFGERFQHALVKDGIANHDNISAPSKKRARVAQRATNL